MRKQTLVNGERFFTPELMEYETLILNARDRMAEVEEDLFGVSAGRWRRLRNAFWRWLRSSGIRCLRGAGRGGGKVSLLPAGTGRERRYRDKTGTPPVVSALRSRALRAQRMYHRYRRAQVVISNRT